MQDIKAKHPDAKVEIVEAETLRNPLRNLLEKKAWWGLIGLSPHIYDALFWTTMALGKLPYASRWMPRHITEAQLRKLIQDKDPDTIVVTHHLSAVTLANLRMSGELRDKRVVLVHTDYYGEIFPKVSKRLDGKGAREPAMTFVAHPKLKDLWVSKGVTPSHVEVSGMPIDPMAKEPIDTYSFVEGFPDGKAELAKLAARGLDKAAILREIEAKKLGRRYFLLSQHLDPDRPVITLMSGGKGVGDFPLMVRKLADSLKDIHPQIVAICGRNATHARNLALMKDDLAREGVSLLIKGPTPERPLTPLHEVFRFVKSSDLYIAKSGGLSPTEGFAMGRPMILLGGVYGGHEKINAKFFGDLGLAVINWKQKDIGEQARELLQDKKKQAAMAVAQKDFVRQIDIGKITDFIFRGR